MKKTLARRIRTKVRDARNDPDRSARRWPFELIQNAHDAGERDGRDGIMVSVALIDEVLRFEHDAAPFSMADLVALLDGGSSKDFDSDETTGRFGTGFLVTHALSEVVRVAGVLEEDGERQAFRVTLNRPDDENGILRNIQDCESELGQTRDVTDFAGRSTATFEYVVDDKDTALVGLDMLEQTLPHLFGSCPRLREVKIQRENRTTRWTAEPGTELHERNGVWINEIAAFSVDEDGEKDAWRVIRAGIAPDARGGLLVALRGRGETWEVSKPGRVPSVFRQLPVLGGPALSTWVIIDGEFDLDQERSSVHVIGEYGRPLSDAFAALEGLALLATREGWVNGYRVAQLAVPTEGVGENAMEVWRDILSSTVGTLAQRPLVKSIRAGMLPAVQTDGYDRWVDFVPQAPTGLSEVELWDLVSRCKGADPPVQYESEGWSEIARGWNDLGVPIYWTDLEKIREVASREADTVAELDVEGEPYKWLSEYLDAVGRTWRATGSITKSHVAHLLPDQHGNLLGAGDLRMDAGVSDRVKDIAADVGSDIRARLVSEVLVRELNDRGLEAGLYALREATASELTEDEAVDGLVQRIQDTLPHEQRVGENEDAATASIALLEHLWRSRGEGASEVAWKVPLLAADGTARRAVENRLMVPPVSMWPKVARPFAAAYPPSRVLADRYADEAEHEDLLEALATWRRAHRGLLTMGPPVELAAGGLRAIAVDPEEVAEARLRGAQFKQIALFEPDIRNYCRQSRERARALLGLLVSYVVSEDGSWRSTVEMPVRTPGGDKQVRLTPSLWLSDLKSKKWIPIEGEEEDTYHVPNPELLRDLIDPAWLEGNSDGADLLERHFGMDALDVRLLAAASDEESRQRLRGGLARIIEVAGDDPQAIEDLAVKAEQRKRNVDQMRNLGLTVQEGVKLTLERQGLKVKFIDRGYDFHVTTVNVREEDTGDLSASFEFGGYKVEIKTTTTGEARLTPLQAETAVNDPRSFVLCVVDLRSFDGDVHQVNWTTTDVSAHCRFVSGRSLPIDATLTSVRNAQGSDVPIRNETALRYAVRPNLWEQGLNLDQWVQDAFAH